MKARRLRKKELIEAIIHEGEKKVKGLMPSMKEKNIGSHHIRAKKIRVIGKRVGDKGGD